jgi:hypothetical protein
LPGPIARARFRFRCAPLGEAFGEGSALVALVTAVSGREVWVAETEPGLKYEPATLDRLRVVESEEEAETVRSRWGGAEGEAEGRRYMLGRRAGRVVFRR